MGRFVLATVTILALAALLVWQSNRERQVARCIATGGVWEGQISRCAPPPPGILIERELKRT